MALTTQAQALFDQARNSIPRWLTSGRNAALEWLYGFAEIFEPIVTLAEDYLSGTYIDTASGRWLDQHARDRDTTRRVDETDATLRERLRSLEDMITDPALQMGINTILGAQINTLASANTILFNDPYNGDSTLVIPAGTYSHAEIIRAVQAGLPEGWSLRYSNGISTLDFVEPETTTPLLRSDFTVTWTSAGNVQAILELPTMGTPPWNFADDGPYRTVIADRQTEVCAITHLRRDRGHMRANLNTTRAELDLEDLTGDGNLAGLVVEAIDTGDPGEAITLAMVSESSLYMTQLGKAITIYFNPATTTVADLEALIDTSHIIRVRTSVGGATLVTGGVETPQNLVTATQGPTAFLSRGYRMSNATRPMTYVVLLPEPLATQAAADAVAEYLRQYGPAGYSAQVEFYP